MAYLYPCAPPYWHGSARQPGQCSVGLLWSPWRLLPRSVPCHQFVSDFWLWHLCSRTTAYLLVPIAWVFVGFLQLFFFILPRLAPQPQWEGPYPFSSASPTWGPRHLEAGQPAGGLSDAGSMGGGGQTGNVFWVLNPPLTSTVSTMLFSPHFSNQDIQQTHKKPN